MIVHVVPSSGSAPRLNLFDIRTIFISSASSGTRSQQQRKGNVFEVIPRNRPSKEEWSTFVMVPSREIQLLPSNEVHRVFFLVFIIIQFDASSFY